MDGSGDYISVALTALPVNSWTSFSFTLNSSGGFLFDGAAAATDPQIQAVLANVVSMHLPADVVTGPSTMGLDNVVLVEVVPEPSTWMLLAATLAMLPWGRRFLRPAR